MMTLPVFHNLGSVYSEMSLMRRRRRSEERYLNFDAWGTHTYSYQERCGCCEDSRPRTRRGEAARAHVTPFLSMSVCQSLSTFGEVKSAQIANGAREHFEFATCIKVHKFDAAAAVPPGPTNGAHATTVDRSRASPID